MKAITPDGTEYPIVMTDTGKLFKLPDGTQITEAEFRKQFGDFSLDQGNVASKNDKTDVRVEKNSQGISRRVAAPIAAAPISTPEPAMSLGDLARQRAKKPLGTPATPSPTAPTPAPTPTQQSSNPLTGMLMQSKMAGGFGPPPQAGMPQGGNMMQPTQGGLPGQTPLGQWQQDQGIDPALLSYLMQAFQQYGGGQA